MTTSDKQRMLKALESYQQQLACNLVENADAEMQEYYKVEIAEVESLRTRLDN